MRKYDGQPRACRGACPGVAVHDSCPPSSLMDLPELQELPSAAAPPACKPGAAPSPPPPRAPVPGAPVPLAPWRRARRLFQAPCTARLPPYLAPLSPSVLPRLTVDRRSERVLRSLILHSMGETADLRGAVIIQRVSKAARDREHSVSDQEDENRADCAAEGWDVAESYSQRKSASRFARSGGRQETWAQVFRRITGEIREKRYAAVVMWESSRGSRTPTDWFEFLDACRDSGTLIRVTSHSRTYDMKNARDWRTLAEDGVDNAYESEKTSQRSRRGIRTAIKEGQGHGQPPTGTSSTTTRAPAGRLTASRTPSAPLSSGRSRSAPRPESLPRRSPATSTPAASPLRPVSPGPSRSSGRSSSTLSTPASGAGAENTATAASTTGTGRRSSPGRSTRTPLTGSPREHRRDGAPGGRRTCCPSSPGAPSAGGRCKAGRRTPAASPATPAPAPAATRPGPTGWTSTSPAW